MEPAARGCRVGVLVGGDTGEHLVPATADPFLVLPPGGVWNGVGVGAAGGSGLNTLLSPERTNR